MLEVSNMLVFYQLCKECGKPLVGNKRNKFCNHTCAAFYNNRNRPILHGTCPQCDKRLPKDRSIFCSTKCRQDNLLDNWIKGASLSNEWGTVPSIIREYLLTEVDNRCPSCGWNEVHPISGKVPLEIDHIDGDSSNNSKENLRVLCPNCHSLTPTFRRRNSKPGRKRKK